jgi:PAS domain-containing protein
MAWNQTMEGLTGVRKRDLLGTKNYTQALSFLQGLRPVLIDLPTEDLVSRHPGVRRFGTSIFVETHVPSLNRGKGVCLWRKASPLQDQEGERIGAIESFRDISAWKRAEEMIIGRDED